MTARYKAVEQREADHAFQIFDDTVRIWNARENAGEFGENGPLPAELTSLIPEHLRRFKDTSTGRWYEITLKKSVHHFAAVDLRDCTRTPIKRENVMRVRRIVSFEHTAELARLSAAG